MESNAYQVLGFYRTKQGAERINQLEAGTPLTRSVGLVNSLDEFERKAIQLDPHILLVEYDPEYPGLADTLARLQRLAPRSKVVALAESDKPEVILQAVRLGVREYLLERVSVEDYHDAVLRLVHMTRTDSAPQGKVIAVMGGSCRAGCSQVALNLSWAFNQEHGLSTALVDMDIYAGELAYLMDLEPEHDLVDVVSQFERLDLSMMDRLLTRHDDGLKLLAGPRDLAHAEDVKGQHAARALYLLACSNQMVICDLCFHPYEVTLAGLDRAEKVVLVVDPTLGGVKSAKRILDLLHRLDHDPRKINLVINRDGAKGSISHADLKKAFKHQITAYLPNDTRSVMTSANAGRVVLKAAPRSKWSKSVKKLAAELL